MCRVGIRQAGMQLADERFRGHLVEDETVHDLTSGRLLEDASRDGMVVGLTDRRLLCVSNAGEFVDIRYDYICSIQSRQQTRMEYRSRNERDQMMTLLGGCLAMATLVAVVLSVLSVGIAEAVLTILLAAATVAVTAGVEYVRKRPHVGRASEQVFIGAGVLALVALVVTGFVASAVSAPLFVIVTLGGFGVVGYGARHRDTLTGLGLDRHRETVLSINTIDGETVRIAVDATADIDRELSASVHRTESAATDFPVARSPSD